MRAFLPLPLLLTWLLPCSPARAGEAARRGAESAPALLPRAVDLRPFYRRGGAGWRPPIGFLAQSTAGLDARGPDAPALSRARAADAEKGAASARARRPSKRRRRLDVTFGPAGLAAPSAVQ